MKANRPSLVLYFVACVLTVLFNLMGQDSFMLYAKSAVVPSIFIYYFTTNNYKVDITKAGVFLFSFIGDVFILMNDEDSETGSVWSFLIVYVLLNMHLFSGLKKIKFDKTVVLSLLIVTIALVILSTTILSLPLDKMKTDFSIIIIYSVVLSILICISVINYVAKGTLAFLNLLLMSVCFLLSDIFYVLNGFYFSLSVFSLIEMTCQVFSYFFMVNYFIEDDKSLRKIKQ
jgi:lysylphosphatidylglycerol synthetase-like protein (DUF2156 family)